MTDTVRRRDGRDRQRLLDALNQAARRFSNQVTFYSQAVASQVGLHPTDLDCLSAIELDGPVTAGRLAEITGLTTGAITGVLDRLEQAGYVRREADPDDRRRVVVRTVPESVRAIGPAFAPMLRAADELHQRYDDDELAVITDWLVRSSPMLREETFRLRDGAASADGATSSAVGQAGQAGLAAATFRVVNGARRLSVVARADQRRLLTARWWGSVPTVRSEGDAVHVQYRRSPFGHFRTRGEVVLDATPRWTIELRGGVAHSTFDLREAHVDRVTIHGGASTLELDLPTPQGTQVVELDGGASAVTIRRPPGVPARVVINGGASNLVLDEQRVGGVGGRTELHTDGYADDVARLDVRLRGGASSVSVVTHSS